MYEREPQTWALALVAWWPAPAMHAPTVDRHLSRQRSSNLPFGVLYGCEQQFESDRNNELDAGTFMNGSGWHAVTDWMRIHKYDEEDPKPWAVAGIRVDASYNSPGCVWPAPAMHAPTVAGTPTQRSAPFCSLGYCTVVSSNLKVTEIMSSMRALFMKWQRLPRCDRFEAHT